MPKVTGKRAHGKRAMSKEQVIKRKKTKRKHNRIRIYLFIKSRLNVLYKAVVYKDYRVWFFNVLTD